MKDFLQIMGNAFYNSSKLSVHDLATIRVNYLARHVACIITC
jgi:hypothetical protein